MSLIRGLSPAPRVAVAALFVLVAAGVVLMGAHAFLGLQPDAHRLFDDVIFTGTIIAVTVICLIRALAFADERWAWLALGVGLVFYSAGAVMWSFWIDELSAPPFPSLADPFWLALYPLSFLAIGLVIRSRITRFPASAWLDGIIASLAAASIGVSFIYDAVAAGSVGSPAAIATNIAYPLADMLLVAAVVLAMTLAHWRLQLSWMALGAGFGLLAAADSIFVVQVYEGTYVPGGTANFLWVAGVSALAIAAWAPPAAPELTRGEGWSAVTIPALFTVVAAGVIVYDQIWPINAPAVGLALATLIVASARTVMAYREARNLAETRREALTDDLTGLANRRHLTRMLAQLDKVGNHQSCLVMVDLDHFKELNDTLGHSCGDQLLREIGPRIAAHVREPHTVSRLGGDEFAVLIAPVTPARAEQIGWEIRAAIAAPFALEGLHLVVDATVGIAIAHGAGESDLLRQADIAMYRAKEDGSGLRVYSAEADEPTRERLALLSELRLAVQHGELVLHYQPKVQPSSGQVVGVEGLIRWQHPRRGLLGPGEFLDLAERGGLMRSLTSLAIERAVAQAAAWAGLGLDITVSVNLETRSLLDVSFPEEVSNTLSRHGLRPDRLELEITETTIMADPVRTMDVLARLGEIGVGLSLDDFGTGYSSLAYLRRLPVGELKIDRSFVTDLVHDRENAAIVRSVIDLAHGFGLRVVAEGVEDAETVRRLAEMSCDLVQGYYFSKPKEARAVTEWIQARMAGAGKALTPSK